MSLKQKQIHKYKKSALKDSITLIKIHNNYWKENYFKFNNQVCKKTKYANMGWAISNSVAEKKNQFIGKFYCKRLNFLKIYG